MLNLNILNILNILNVLNIVENTTLLYFTLPLEIITSMFSEMFSHMNVCVSDDRKMAKFTEVADMYSSSGFTVPDVIRMNQGSDLSTLIESASIKILLNSMVDPDGVSEVSYPFVEDNGCVPMFHPMLNEHIGEGTYGHVYSMSRSRYSSDTVAVKFQSHSVGQKGWDAWVPGPSQMDIPMNPFEKEVAIQLHVGSFLLAPAVFNAWVAKYKTVWGDGKQDVFIMERMDKTIRDKTVQEKSFIAGVMDTIRSMHDLKVFHGDMHSGNIMVDSSSKPFMIDFGKSKVMPADVEGIKWCKLHDLMNLYQTLPNKAVLKGLVREEARSIQSNFYVLNTKFDFE